MELIMNNSDVIDALKQSARKKVAILPDEEMTVKLVRSLKPLGYSAHITITKLDSGKSENSTESTKLPGEVQQELELDQVEKLDEDTKEENLKDSSETSLFTDAVS
jgi:hypothetical protein